MDAAPVNLWTPPKPAIIRASRLPETPVQARGIRLGAMGLMPFFMPRASGAFPTVVQATTATSPNGNTHTFSFGFTASALDLIIVIASFGNDRTITWPTGWNGANILWSQNDGTAQSSGASYKIAAGGETSVSGIATNGVTVVGAAVVYRITGYTGVPEGVAGVTGASANPNQPNLAPSWGLKKALWLACSASRGTTLTNYPSNYTDGLFATNGGTGSNTTRSGVARRFFEASSEDPGTFTLGTSVNWIAGTIAVSGT